MTAFSVRRFKPRANLATIALVSFTISFVAARTFTSFFPSIVLIASGIHVHHFWFGIALLAIGGWLGISYNDRATDRLAAILYGAGSGLIVDEVGLLLTFGNYWTTLTYTFLIILSASITILVFFYRYRQTIVSEFAEFVSRNGSLYFGVFLFAVSIAFIMETDDVIVTVVSSGIAVTATIIILAYLAVRIKRTKERTT
jgi:hypothetical protein